MHVEVQRNEYWEFVEARIKREIRDCEYEGKDTSELYKELREVQDNLRNSRETLYY